MKDVFELHVSHVCDEVEYHTLCTGIFYRDSITKFNSMQDQVQGFINCSISSHVAIHFITHLSTWAIKALSVL